MKLAMLPTADNTIHDAIPSPNHRGTILVAKMAIAPAKSGHISAIT
jgi:hypothetical protein